MTADDSRAPGWAAKQARAPSGRAVRLTVALCIVIPSGFVVLGGILVVMGSRVATGPGLGFWVAVVGLVVGVSWLVAICRSWDEGGVSRAPGTAQVPRGPAAAAVSALLRTRGAVAADGSTGQALGELREVRRRGNQALGLFTETQARLTQQQGDGAASPPSGMTWDQCHDQAAAGLWWWIADCDDTVRRLLGPAKVAAMDAYHWPKSIERHVPSGVCRRHEGLWRKAFYRIEWLSFPDS